MTTVRLAVCALALCALLCHAAGLRTTVHRLRPIPVILAELHADESSSSSEESSAMAGGSSSESSSLSMDASQESSFGAESAGAAPAATPLESSQESSGGESTISATDVDGSSSSSSSSSMESTSNTAMPAAQPGSDPMASMSLPSDSASARKSGQSGSAAASQSSGTPFPAGSSFNAPSPVGRVPGSQSHESSSASSTARLPETDVFGEAPHTDLSTDQVDLIARAVLMGARKSRCAHEDEYCEMQFKKCKDEKCRRQVEDQSSLSPLEQREIRDLLRT